jgi:hypothetical protein
VWPSDIGRLDFCLTELQPKDTPTDQRKTMKIARWGVAVFLLLGFDEENKLERPVGTTATNVTSRANNRTTASPTMRPFPLNREPNGSTTPTGQNPTGHSPL